MGLIIFILIPIYLILAVEHYRAIRQPEPLVQTEYIISARLTFCCLTVRSIIFLPFIGIIKILHFFGFISFSTKMYLINWFFNFFVYEPSIFLVFVYTFILIYMYFSLFLKLKNFISK